MEHRRNQVMGAHRTKISMRAAETVAPTVPEVIDDVIVLTLVDQISDAVIVHDGIRIIHANAQAAELSGLPPDELVGRPLESLFPDPEHGAELWPARSRVVSVARPEGGARALTVSEVPLLLRGEPAVAMLLRDPKVATFSVETVAALDRMRTGAVLAAGLAHEVSNALVALIAGLEGMAELVDIAEAGELAGNLDLAREAASAITGMVRDFHAYVRAGAVVGRGRVDPRPAVERALRLAGPRLRRAASVGAHIDDVGTVRATDSALTQVALNLLLNAADALPAAEPGARNRIEVRLERQGDHVCLEVADNGRGIPPGMMNRLFEPLVTTKLGGDGAGATVGSSGLGLAICRELARSFGGQISVHVEPGKGTAFRVLLPAEEDT
jgi:two-component system, NtrC family, sensor kinase